MTVSDLIFQLQECDKPDMEVAIEVQERGTGIYMRSTDITEIFYDKTDVVTILAGGPVDPMDEE